MIDTSIGLELEFNGRTDLLNSALAAQGLAVQDEQHPYHCECAGCNFSSGYVWRHQRDSTVSGEFITKIMWTWPEMLYATQAIEAAIAEVDAAYGSGQVTVGVNTGMHVHVGRAFPNHGYCEPEQACYTYLLYERWIQKLGAGPFSDKREGMNLTMLDALRASYNNSPHSSLTDTEVPPMEAGSRCREQIEADRHVDLNISQRYGTLEYRVFNGATVAWQMELAMRLSVAVTRLALTMRLDQRDPILIPPSARRTLTPDISLEEFMDLTCHYDPALAPLYELRQELNPLPIPQREPMTVPAVHAHGRTGRRRGRSTFDQQVGDLRLWSRCDCETCHGAIWNLLDELSYSDRVSVVDEAGLGPDFYSAPPWNDDDD